MKRGIIEEKEHEQPAGTSFEPETTAARGVTGRKRKRTKKLTGTSFEPETTAAQGVTGRKRKRTKKLTGLDESVSFKPGTLSGDDVLFIAHELGPSWKMFARVLKVPDSVIDKIDVVEPGVAEKCYCVIRRWQERHASDATYHRLALALQHPTVDRVDVAVKYCSLPLGKDVAVAKDY